MKKKKMNLDLYFTLYTKNKTKTKTLKMDQIPKLLEENIGKTPCGLRLHKGFLDMTQKAP